MHCISTVYLASYSFWDNLQHKADKFSALLHHAYLFELSMFSNQQSSEHAWRLSSLKSNIESLQSFLPLKFICLHFFILVTMLVDFCTLLCVCWSAAKDTHFFWSCYVLDSAFIFVLSQAVNMYISASLCLSVPI